MIDPLPAGAEPPASVPAGSLPAAVLTGSVPAADASASVPAGADPASVSTDVASVSSASLSSSPHAAATNSSDARANGMVRRMFTLRPPGGFGGPYRPHAGSPRRRYDETSAAGCTGGSVPAARIRREERWRTPGETRARWSSANAASTVKTRMMMAIEAPAITA